MSCIRFNTPDQRQAMRDHRPIMRDADSARDAAAAHPAPEFTESKLRRLRLLASDAIPKIREAAASSYHIPADLFPVLVADSDEGVRGCLAHNETTPDTVLRMLASDASERVRGLVALNSRVPADVIRQFEHDDSETVRGLVHWRASVEGENA